MVKIISNVCDNGVNFLESDGVKYKEDPGFLLFEDISKNIPLINQRKQFLIYEYLSM